MIVIAVYCLLMLVVFIYNFRGDNYTFFKSKGKISWMISGLSLYMFYLSADQGQFLMGLIAEHGMSGLWMVWAGIIGSFVVPIVFAPLWQKLDFITDNQFLLFRYPGQSGRYLHAFRALYVGGLVVALLLCFYLIGFSRILAVFLNIDETYGLVISGCILIIYSLKDLFDLKLKLDAFHAVLFFIALLVILISIGLKMEGIGDVFNYFKANPEKRQIFPDKMDHGAWFSFIVYIGIQWWSCNLFDGGGPEMSRFTAVKGKKSAILTGLLPIFISFFLGFFMIGHILVLLGMSSPTSNSEIQYVHAVFTLVPESFQMIVLLGFFGMFITTAESLLNWGASFLTIDIYQTHLTKKKTSKGLKGVAFMSMTFLCLLSMIFSFYIESLQSLVKVTFSIAAGVAPVYILRWVWFRINAWSQISAMLSSAIFTLVYPFFHDHLPFSMYPEAESRIVVVTILTTLTWLLVTLITRDQSELIKSKMENLISSINSFKSKMLLALSLGIFVLLTQSLIWYLIVNS